MHFVTGLAHRLAVLLVVLPALVAASESYVETGHSAIWYAPDRSGEGWVVDVLNAERATVTWFTYDEAGKQRWLFGVGEIDADESGSYINVDQLTSTSGARFGAGFDPNDVQYAVVGDATLRFQDCERGTFSYSAYGQAHTIAIQRLSRTMAAGCAPIHGVTGQPVFAHAGQSGSWYDVSHSGEGFQLQWSSDNRALLTWYSYDPHGEQYWMIGIGRLENGRIIFPEILSTHGARFGEAFRSEDVEYIDWGSLELELSCLGGYARYESPLPGFGSGELDLSRLTITVSLPCPWTEPKIADLYDISLRELPISVPGHYLDTIQVRSIADDGTVVGVIGTSGTGKFQLVQIGPNDSNWQALSGVDEVDFAPASIAPDKFWILANLEEEPGTFEFEPSLYREGLGWQPLNNLLLESNLAEGASQDLSRIVGTGANSSDTISRPWIWDERVGQSLLPVNDDIRFVQLRAASNDGRIVIGESAAPGPGGVTAFRGVRWVDDALPEILRDLHDVELGGATTCDAECSIIFGSAQAVADSQHPSSGQAWYWKASGASGYFGHPPGGTPAFAVPIDATPDGNLVVGRDSNGDAFIWTQNTGTVSVRTLLAEQGLPGSNWRELRAVGVTSDGRTILLWGIEDHPVPQQPSAFRPAVLILDERTVD